MPSPQADIDEFVSHYSAPGGMRDGFNQFRAFPEDAIQNMNYSKTKLTMPVLAVGAGYIPHLEGTLLNYAYQTGISVILLLLLPLIIETVGGRERQLATYMLDPTNSISTGSSPTLTSSDFQILDTSLWCHHYE